MEDDAPHDAARHRTLPDTGDWSDDRWYAEDATVLAGVEKLRFFLVTSDAAARGDASEEDVAAYAGW